MKTITQAKAKKLIKESNGAFFSAKFTKKDGEKRKMVARIGVTKYLNNGILSFNPENNGYMVVFDTNKRGYRMLNLKTLERLKIGGQSFKVV